MKKIILRLLGRMGSQKFFEFLHTLSIKGMNIGIDSGTAESGEKWVMDYVAEKSKGKADVTIFDVGANVGKFSLLCHEVFKNLPNVKIHAFEPIKSTFTELKKNAGENKNIGMNNFGLGADNRTLPMFSNKDDSGFSSLYERRLDHFNLKLSEKEDVSIKKLDDYCVENMIENIDFLKMDVEGHEMDILRGGQKC